MLMQSIRDVLVLTKSRLALSVVFSSVAGYFLAASTIEGTSILLLFFGGYCMVGASNAYNQIIEKDLDLLMRRTQNRPIPAGRMTVTTAFVIASLLTLLGIGLLLVLNPKTAFFGTLSLLLYTCVYTPLKTRTPLAVFVGAFPGAIPFMLGWVAATNEFGIEPGTLFMIQFFWQFPHFWAIGWMLHKEYDKAGFKMLPFGNPGKSTALQIVLYTLWTIIAAVFPVLGLTGALKISVVAAIVVGFLGLGLLYFALSLFQSLNNKAAKNMMLASVAYITLIQIIFVLDKLLI